MKREVEELKNGGRAFERVKRLRKHVMAARGGGWSGEMQAEVLSKQQDDVHLLKIRQKKVRSGPRVPYLLLIAPKCTKSL